MKLPTNSSNAKQGLVITLLLFVNPHWGCIVDEIKPNVTDSRIIGIKSGAIFLDPISSEQLSALLSSAERESLRRNIGGSDNAPEVYLYDNSLLSKIVEVVCGAHPDLVIVSIDNVETDRALAKRISTSFRSRGVTTLLAMFEESTARVYSVAPEVACAHDLRSSLE